MSREFLLLVAALLAAGGVGYAQFVLAVKPQPSPCAERCVVEPAREPEPEPVRLGAGDLLAGVPGEGPITAAQALEWLADPRNHHPLTPLLPVGLEAGALDLPAASENPLTRAKIELGRQLFFDKRLSVDASVSCATCHDPRHGYAGGARFSAGVRGALGTRNSPTAANRILSTHQFWDGRAASLEEQALGPIASPAEMALPHKAAVERLRGIAAYRAQFERVFPEGVTIENVGRALAAFERAVVSGPTPWDLYKRLVDFEEQFDGDFSDLSPEELAVLGSLREAADARPLAEPARRGGELFFGDRAGCTQCHAGANFTDGAYHNLGVGLDPRSGEPTDHGRAAVTGADADRGAFKTPGLRNVAQTPPYMHDGSLATLADVVAWYAQGGEPNPHLSPLVEPLDLTAEEQADLVAFLESLTGDWPTVETGRLPAE